MVAQETAGYRLIPFPTIQQYGYRHMLIENEVLTILGDKAKEWIKTLKKQGFKTEPAFGRLLGLEGNYYEQLLDFETWDKDQLERHLSTISLEGL